MKKYRTFSRVFDITNQLLTRHSPFAPLGQNEPFSIQGRLSEFFRIWLLKHWKILVAYRRWRSNFPRRGRKPNHGKKTESYVFSCFGNGIFQAEKENRQLEDLPQADFGYVPERFLLSVTTKSINENFVYWKLRPSFGFVLFQRIFLSWPWCQRTLWFLFGDCWSPSFHLLIKLNFLVRKGLLRLYDKQNNTWFLVDVKFLFSYSNRHLTRALRSLVNTQREILYLRALVYYSIFINFSVLENFSSAVILRKVDLVFRNRAPVYGL